MSVIKRVDHVAVAVHDIAVAERFLIEVLGAHPNVTPRLNHDETFYWADYILAGFKIELVQPVDPEDGDIGRYLRKYGEGLHHISMEVKDIHEAIDHFEAQGSRVVQKDIDKTVGWRDAFLSPRTSHGVLFQIWDELRPTQE